MAAKRAALEATILRRLADSAEQMEKMQEMIVYQTRMIGELALQSTELEARLEALEDARPSMGP